MFEAIDLSSRPIPELKEIARAFSIDSIGLPRHELILKIIDAQSGDSTLAREIASKFPVKTNGSNSDGEHHSKSSKRDREKRPRRVKLDPIIEDSVQDSMSANQEEETENPPVAETPVEETTPASPVENRSESQEQEMPEQHREQESE